MRQGERRIKVYGLVEVCERGIVLLPGSLQPAAADVALGFKAVYLDGVVVVFQGLCGVSKEKVGRTPVQVGCRVLGLFPYILVKVLHGALELAAQEVGDAPCEVQAVGPGPKRNGLLKVLEGGIVVSGAAFRDGAVMVAGSENGVQAHRRGEIGLCATDVPKVVLGYTPVEEGPVICGVQLRKDVEIGYGL